MRLLIACWLATTAWSTFGGCSESESTGSPDSNSATDTDGDGDTDTDTDTDSDSDTDTDTDSDSDADTDTDTDADTDTDIDTDTDTDSDTDTDTDTDTDIDGDSDADTDSDTDTDSDSDGDSDPDTDTDTTTDLNECTSELNGRCTPLTDDCAVCAENRLPHSTAAECGSDAWCCIIKEPLDPSCEENGGVCINNELSESCPPCWDFIWTACEKKDEYCCGTGSACPDRF